MNILKKIIAIALLLTISACATPYQEMAALGGVKATRLSSDRAQIVAVVNGYTDRSVAEQYALLKAAEYTIENGYGHFAIISQAADANKETNFTYNYYTGFQTYSFENPRNDITIKMYAGSAPSNAPMNIYDARSIVTTLGSQVLRPS